MRQYKNSILIGLGLINILIHLLFYNKLEYHRDELLYFSLGMHPDFGYATVPPMIGWIATLMQFMFGYSLFAVKIFPALLSGVFVIVSTSIAKELGGKTFAQILTGIAVIIMPVTLRAFHLFQPVSLDYFFWTLIFYCTIRYVNSQNDKYMIALFAVSGLALLNKYLVALLLLSLLFSILLTRHRDIFKKRALYTGLVIGLLIFLPNLIWQIVNKLPVINHIHELNMYQLVHVSRIDFLVDQLIMPYASSLIILTGVIFLWRNKEYQFIVISIFFVILTLLILRGKSYYTIGVFPVMIAAGAVAIEKHIKKRWVLYAIPLFMLLITIPVIPFGIPVYNQAGMVRYFKNLEDKYDLLVGRRFEDGSIHSLPQDYADQLGWEELTKLTSSAYQKIPDKQKALIYCENYGQAGAISVIGKKYNLPEPVCFNESFIYWVPSKFDPDIEYFIYINDELGDDIKELFNEIEVTGSISNINAREYGTTVYLCTHPNSSFNSFWQTVLLRFNSK